jgi:TolB-like protein/Flp pilus assembly protein TadD
VKPGALSALLLELALRPAGLQAGAWDPTLYPGAMIGKFELVRELGRGGFGVVWEARDRELGRSVAFKALRAGGEAGLREERLLKEAEAAARLQHPNIVTLFDIGRTEQGPYLVLELLRGRTLRERLGQGALPVREALHIGIEVAKGVAHAHGQGVIHRDLKPENVFLCEDGQVKVLDFGLAHAFGQRKVEGGTRGYMAPEQLRGAPEDERTDVFAQGVVLHEIFSGKRPAPGKGPSGADRDPPARLEVPEVPSLGPLVARMLATDPVGRPRDGGEVLQALSVVEEEVAAAGVIRDGVRRMAASPMEALYRARRGRRLAVLLCVLGLVAAAPGAAWYLWKGRPAQAAGSPAGATATAPSIAVLPFADMSPQKDQEYFADGVAEEILGALARVAGLRVIGRTSSFSFRGRSEDVATIAEKLRVSTLLEGSVRRDGDQVRVTARLIDATDGAEVWSERFDRRLTAILLVQDDIAQAVVHALKVKLLPGRGPASADRRPREPEAYRQYLLGRDYTRRGIKEQDVRLAAEAYEKAIALDAAYAPAWAGLSGALLVVSDYESTAAGIATARERSAAAAEKAVALDPGLPDGYLARAYIQQILTWDFAGAQADIEKAHALAPGDVRANRDRGNILRVLGRPREAMPSLRKAVDLDPLDGVAWAMLGTALAAQGDTAGARAAFERARKTNPDDLWNLLGELSLLEGQPAAALAAFERAPEEVWRTQGVALARHALGQREAAKAALDALTTRFADSWAYQIAGVHSFRGDRDAAFEWLDRAYRQHDGGLLHVKSDPLLSPLRGDPRYAALLEKMHLPVDSSTGRPISDGAAADAP